MALFVTQFPSRASVFFMNKSFVVLEFPQIIKIHKGQKSILDEGILISRDIEPASNIAHNKHDRMKELRLA